MQDRQREMLHSAATPPAQKAFVRQVVVELSAVERDIVLPGDQFRLANDEIDVERSLAAMQSVRNERGDHAGRCPGLGEADPQIPVGKIGQLRIEGSDAAQCRPSHNHA